MVTTLIKHEIRRTLRWYATIVGGAVLIVALSVAAAEILPTPLAEFFNLISAVVAFGLAGAIPVWLGIDFYRSSYSKTGYLTRALPVKGTTIFWVKLLYAYVLSLVTLLVSVGLIYVMWIGFIHSRGGTIAELHAAIDEATRVIRAFPGWALAALVLVIALMPLVWLASYYFAATVGSEAWANKLGIGGPILVWFLFYMASQAIALLGVLIPIQVEFAAGMPKVVIAMLDFTDPNGADVMPLGVFLTMFVLSAVAIVWAAVSFDRKAELR